MLLKRRSITLTASLLLATLSAAPTWSAEVRSYPLSNTIKDRSGLVYYLPKTLLEISYEADLRELKVKENKSLEVIVKPETIKVTPHQTSDTKQAFFIPTKNLSSLLVDTKKAHVEIADSGLLKSIVLNTEDMTPQIIEDALVTAENAMKIAIIISAMSGENITEQPTEASLKVLKTFVVKELIDPDTVTTSPKAIGASSLDIALKRCLQVPSLTSILNRYEMLGLSCRSENTFQNTQSTKPKRGYAKGILLRTGHPTVFDISTLTASSSSQLRGTTNAQADPLYSVILPISQFGFVSNVPFQSKFFTNREQTLSWNEDPKDTKRGLVYSLYSSSSLEKASEVFATVAGNFLDFSSALPKLRFEVQQKVADAAAESAATQSALEKEQDAIEELEKASIKKNNIEVAP